MSINKTGTLTQNKMVVQKVYTATYHFSVTGEGYEPSGTFYCHRKDRIETEPEVKKLFQACVLCNDAFLQQSQNIAEKTVEWSILGDPTEGALLVLAAKGFVSKSEMDEIMPRLSEFPFDWERKRMSVIVANPNDQKLPYLMITKGSTESILARCDRLQIENNSELISNIKRQKFLAINDCLASQGLRVLSFAYKPLAEVPPLGTENENEQGLIWLGLVGMINSLRVEPSNTVNNREFDL